MNPFVRQVIPLSCFVTLSALAACTPTRMAAVPASEEEDAISVDGMKGIRYWGDETTPEMIRDAKDAFDREAAARKAAIPRSSRPKLPLRPTDFIDGRYTCLHFAPSRDV